MSSKRNTQDESRHVLAPIFNFFESFLDPFKTPPTLELPADLADFIWHFVKQAKYAFGLSIFLGISHGVLEALLLSVGGQVVDMLGALEDQPRSWAAIFDYQAGFLAYLFLAVILLRVAVIISAAINEEQFLVPGFFNQTRWQIHQSVMRQSLSYFQNDLSGRLASKVFQSGQLIGDTMLKAVNTLLFIGVFALSSLSILASMHWMLVLISCMWLLLIANFAYWLVPQIRYRAKLSAESSATASGRMVDSYSNIASVKLYAPSDPFVKAGIEQHFEHLKLFSRVLTRLRGGNVLINTVMFTALVLCAIDLWLSKHLSTGDVSVVIAFALRLQMMSNRLLGNLNALFRYLGSIENIMGSVAKTPMLRDDPDAPKIPRTYHPKRIEFKSISFAYNGQSQILHDIDVCIRAGERIGIVGPSGAGKTSFIQLLLRYFDPNVGEITLDGMDIRKLEQNSYRQLFSIVQQDALLFHRSIRDNVAYGSDAPSDEAIWQALAQADAKDFVEAIVDRDGNRGLDALVGERGVKLSGGQRQRIHLARVFLRDAPLLVLDEATSQLDSLTENSILSQLDDFSDNKTVIAIAHRLSTVQKLDRIWLFDQGSIVAEGTHASLYKDFASYRALWDAQQQSAPN